MNLDRKKEITKELNEKFSKSTIVVTTDYKGLDVAAMTDLRSRLRKENIEYQVVKNSLLVRASEDTDVKLMTDYFKGPSGVAISYDDAVTPAKVLDKFAKENNKFEIKAAVMSGKLLDLDDLKALSKLPSREVLLSQMLSALNGVPTGFVRMLSQIPQGMVNVLQAIKDQKESAE